jgi:hypothetical protein
MIVWLWRLVRLRLLLGLARMVVRLLRARRAPGP